LNGPSVPLPLFVVLLVMPWLIVMLAIRVNGPMGPPRFVSARVEVATVTFDGNGPGAEPAGLPPLMDVLKAATVNPPPQVTPKAAQ
jgi:hypothetical protein